MRAMILPEFGGTELFEKREIARPEPGTGEVLVRIVACSANTLDAILRVDGGFGGLHPPVILGADASGVIESTGTGVRDLAVGDEVYYMAEVFGPGSNGCYAEYHAVPARLVARKPSGLSHEQAATVPVAGGTAYEAVVNRLAVGVGETVLIHGGAGGVGSFAVQLAKAAGARVVASAGTANQRTLRDLGVDRAIDYTREDVFETALDDTGGKGVDAVLDTVGGDMIANSVPVTRVSGRLAGIISLHGDLTPAYERNQTLHGVAAEVGLSSTRLEALTRLIERSQLHPLVDDVLDLDQVGEAHRRLDSGHGRGKVALRIAEHGP